MSLSAQLARHSRCPRPFLQRRGALVPHAQRAPRTFDAVLNSDPWPIATMRLPLPQASPPAAGTTGSFAESSSLTSATNGPSGAGAAGNSTAAPAPAPVSTSATTPGPAQPVSVSQAGDEGMGGFQTQSLLGHCIGVTGGAFACLQGTCQVLQWTCSLPLSPPVCKHQQLSMAQHASPSSFATVLAKHRLVHDCIGRTFPRRLAPPRGYLPTYQPIYRPTLCIDCTAS